MLRQSLIPRPSQCKFFDSCMRTQVKEQQALRMKGKLALGGAASGSGRFNAKFMRTLSLQPSGASGATWQVCPVLARQQHPQKPRLWLTSTLSVVDKTGKMK